MPYKDRQKYLESQKSYYSKNKPKYKTAAMKSQRLIRYGLTQEAYEALLQSQDYRCSICRLPPRGNGLNDKILQVDHDHADGRVRGLLCGPCNRGLGCFRDSVEHMTKAIDYIQRKN